MPAGPSPTHDQRRRRRHELRTLTYVTLDQANGGIVRVGISLVAVEFRLHQLDPGKENAQ